MAERKPLLHYLAKLWDEAGLRSSELVDEEGNARISVDEALSFIKDELANDVLPVGEANVLQARLTSFEGEVNRLTAIEKVPREALHTATPRFHFGSALETVGRNTRAALREAGSPAYFHMPTLPEAGRLITSADLGLLPDNFNQRWLQWETKVERALMAHEEKDFAYDPFYVRLGALPRQQREPLLREYDVLMGFKDLRERGLGPTFLKDVQDARGAVIRSPAARYAVEVDPNDPRTLALARTIFQYKPGLVGYEQPSNMYLPSGRIARSEVHTHTANVLREHMAKPGKTLVFDVESAGLNPEEGIWQLAARMVDENGDLIHDVNGVPRIADLRFHNPVMQWKGELGRNRQSLEQFLSGGQDIKNFPEGLKDFFDMVDEADYVGGHNIFFDFNMITRGLKIKAKQLNDPEFSRGVDSFISKFFDQDTGQLNRVLDTHILAQTQLRNIALAPELRALEVAQPFSLQNILLQTDLLDRVRAAHGDEVVDTWLKRGLHYADVDVPIESHLLTALREMVTGNGPGLRFVTGAGQRGPVSGWRRERILHSSAITPLTRIADFESQVNDALVPKMLKSGLIDFDLDRLRTAGFDSVEDMVSKGVLTKENIARAGLTDAITKIHMTPMEQKIAAERSFSMPIPERPFLTQSQSYSEAFRSATGSIWEKLRKTFWDRPEFPDRSMAEMAYQAGVWRHLSKDFITKKAGTISHRLGVIPGIDEWEDIQNRLAEGGIPFAHSSMIERHLMASLGQAIGPSLGQNERAVREIYGADVASLGRWSSTQSLYVSGEGENLIMRIPHSHLIEAGLMSTGENEPQFLALSPFKFTNEAGVKHHEIGVMFQFSEDAEKSLTERGRLLEFLAEKYSGQPELLAQAKRALESPNAGLYGLQVGTFGGVGKQLKNPDAATKLYNILAQIIGKDVDRGGENTAQVLVAYAPLPGEETGSRWLHTAGAFIGRRMLDKEDLQGIAYHKKQAVRLYTQATEQVKNDVVMAHIAALAGRDANMDAAALKMAHGYTTIKKRAPLFALGAAVIGGIGYKIHKNRENRYTDQAMEAQALEDDNWYDQYRSEISTTHRPVQYRQTPPGNPLSTAGLMRTLDRRKTNHTNMSSDRYGYLFSRGYN